MADFNRIAESDLVKMAIAMIVGGALVAIVAFVGCLGAMRESYKLLMTVGFYETLGESYWKGTDWTLLWELSEVKTNTVPNQFLILNWLY